MPRRKRNAAAPTSHGVEEQLRKQRLERQKGLESKKGEDVRRSGDEIKEPILGDFVYDSKRDTYFPKGFNPNQNEPLEEEKGDIFPCHPYSLIPKRNPHMYGLATEICPSPSLRRRISSHWRGRYLLSNISVDTDRRLSGFALGNPQSSASPNHRGFSVQANKGYDSIAWSVSDGYMRTAQLVGTGPVFSERNFAFTPRSSVDVVKHCCCEHSEYTAWLTHQQTRLTITREEQIRYEVHLETPANDFSMLPTGDVDFVAAHDKGRWSRQQGFTIITKLRPHRLVRSDILTIEYWAGTNSVVLGHRDGRPSLSDLRTMNKSWYCEPDIQYGNISSLHPLDDDVTFLTKSFHGACRLYDIRKNTPMFHMDHDNRFCKGMTVDESNSVLIHPSLTKTNQSVLEVWSLTTGDYIDAYELPDDGPCELCPTIMPGSGGRGSRLWIGRPNQFYRVNFNEKFLCSNTN